MSYWKHGIKVEESVDETTGQYQMKFECPECREWSPVIRHDRIEAVTFLCKNPNCQFEANASTVHNHGGEIH